MTATAFQPEFAPPDDRARSPAWAMALLAHGVLIIALAWGTSWKREAPELNVEAEVWAALPAPQAPPPPEPAAATPPPPAPASPVPADADAHIAVQRAKEEAAKRKADQDALDAKRKAAAEHEARERESRVRAERDKQAAAKRAEDERLKQQAAIRAAEAQAEAERQAHIRRLQGMAGGSVAASGIQGAAARAAGPSDSYAGRVRARVKPNIVYTDAGAGNPQVEIEVRLAPDGTIISQRVLKPSGQAPWDEAVLRALEKTQVLPRDTDGRAPTGLVLVFRPRD